ncbi:MAG: DUF1648 domain-containing protein [Candidatus Eremiobacteraeota bacterium]|nr:DUF1648 domain-containing protein [Candidatus Eremiobacteraeota bacterium]
MGATFPESGEYHSVVLTYALAAAIFGIVAVTAAVTAAEYPNLPDRVPMHFALDGTPTTYAPRPMIWLVVVIQILSMAIIAGTASVAAQGRHPTALGVGVFGVCIAAALAAGQFGIISAAKSPGQCLDVKRFLLPIGALAVLAILSLSTL